MLRLRPPWPGDERTFRDGHEQMAAEDFTFGLEREPDMAWQDYLRRLADSRAGLNLPEGWVGSTFLVADMDGQIVGRVSIRHQLNEFLRTEGGHIGYCVLPAYRRRGYATEMLRQALIVARSLAIDHVLVSCVPDNIGSIRVIESCGGKLDSVRPAKPGTPALRRYWID